MLTYDVRTHTYTKKKVGDFCWPAERAQAREWDVATIVGSSAYNSPSRDTLSAVDEKVAVMSSNSSLARRRRSIPTPTSSDVGQGRKEQNSTSPTLAAQQKLFSGRAAAAVAQFPEQERVAAETMSASRSSVSSAAAVSGCSSRGSSNGDVLSTWRSTDISPSLSSSPSSPPCSSLFDASSSRSQSPSRRRRERESSMALQTRSNDQASISSARNRGREKRLWPSSSSSKSESR